MKPTILRERSQPTVIDVQVVERHLPAKMDQPSKNIDVLIVESGQRHPLTIMPTTRLSDVREKLSLGSSYVLVREDNEQAFNQVNSLYDQVPDGATILASSAVDVGTEAHTPLLVRWWRMILQGSFLDQFIRSRGPVRQGAPLWEQRRWIREGTDYRGLFRTRHGTWHGRATRGAADGITMFIFWPPPELFKHPKGSCFLHRGGNAYMMHTMRPIRDVSAGIVRIEEILNEALRAKRN